MVGKSHALERRRGRLARTREFGSVTDSARLHIATVPAMASRINGLTRIAIDLS